MQKLKIVRIISSFKIVKMDWDDVKRRDNYLRKF